MLRFSCGSGSISILGFVVHGAIWHENVVCETICYQVSGI